MNAIMILSTVKSRGASITLKVDQDGTDRLIIEPASRCRDLLPAIREMKAQLVAILRRNSDGGDWKRDLAQQTTTTDDYIRSVLTIYHTYERRFPGWRVPDIDRAIDRTIAIECLKRAGGVS